MFISVRRIIHEGSGWLSFVWSDAAAFCLLDQGEDHYWVALDLSFDSFVLINAHNALVVIYHRQIALLNLRCFLAWMVGWGAVRCWLLSTSWISTVLLEFFGTFVTISVTMTAFILTGCFSKVQIHLRPKYPYVDHRPRHFIVCGLTSSLNFAGNLPKNLLHFCFLNFDSNLNFFILTVCLTDLVSWLIQKE